jgi:hypothetical protein
VVGAFTDTFWAYDGDEPILEFASGTATAPSHRYLWGPAVDQILADEQVATGSPADVRWPMTDWQGTVRDVATYNASTNVTTIANHKVYEGGWPCSRRQATIRNRVPLPTCWQCSKHSCPRPHSQPEGWPKKTLDFFRRAGIITCTSVSNQKALTKRLGLTRAHKRWSCWRLEMILSPQTGPSPPHLPMADDDLIRRAAEIY